MKKPVVRKLRCAVYTRKSTEEGLDQEFNSLDAQRESCEAFVASQRAEGWLLVPDRYDDGGYSGGTLERPALKRLIADIEARRVDVIICYKIDRLSRSLMDFAKLVEILERNNVTFVSVTQSFNTTTSMGRLTLNVLLSFAQFEREVIGERIRDKFAASRKKGMWMGGFVPLGYDLKDRKLVINKAEAETVRSIFQRFARSGSATTLVRELRAEGVKGKQGKGLIFGPTGAAMTPTHTRRRGRLYRYYVSTGLLKRGPEACPIGRVPAAEIEAAVVEQVRALLRSPEIVVQTWRMARRSIEGLTARETREALERFEPLWDELFPAEQARIVQLLVDRVDVGLDGIAIRLRTEGLASLCADLRAGDPEHQKAA